MSKFLELPSQRKEKRKLREKSSKLLKPWKQASQEKCVSLKNLKNHVANLREKGLTLATLNGSFDVLHAGHLHIIYEAAQVADILIVGLNSDCSIKLYKSSLRPIIPLEYRMEMMTALGFVDFVTSFDETHPLCFLEIVKPDVHVNGAEYGEECLEADLVKKYGGEIHIASLIPGLSTSYIINKINEIEQSCV